MIEVILWGAKYAIHLFSDRENLIDRDTVEQFETDLALGLRSQLLVQHGDPLLFGRLLLQVIPLRAMTTLHLEDILNSPLQVIAVNNHSTY